MNGTNFDLTAAMAIDGPKRPLFCGFSAELSGAEAVVYGAPCDSTASYQPGSRFASVAMRHASDSLETWSPHLDKDLTDFHIADAGELELPRGNMPLVMERIRKTTADILRAGAIPIMIGGEHSLTYGAVRAAYERYPDLEVIHLDAHTDLRPDYLGEKYSHASVMRRVWELLGDGRIHQFGIRSGTREEFVWAREHLNFHPFELSALPATLEKLRGRPLYFSLDLDVLDPGCFPGTGTPEPGGVGFAELITAIYSLVGQNVVACDLMELAPTLDPSGISTVTACKLLRELLLIIL